MSSPVYPSGISELSQELDFHFRFRLDLIVKRGVGEAILNRLV